MNELAEWFAKQVQTTISRSQQDPVEEDEYEPSEDDDDSEDDEDDNDDESE